MRQAHGIGGRGLDTMGPASLEGCDREVVCPPSWYHSQSRDVSGSSFLINPAVFATGIGYGDLWVDWDVVAQGDGAWRGSIGALVKHEVNCR